MDFSPNGVFTVKKFRNKDFSLYGIFTVRSFCRAEFAQYGLFKVCFRLAVSISKFDVEFSQMKSFQGSE